MPSMQTALLYPQGGRDVVGGGNMIGGPVSGGAPVASQGGYVSPMTTGMVGSGIGSMIGALGGPVGSALGSSIGGNIGGYGPSRSMGTGIGSLIGSAFGPVGSLVGGAIGGYIGGQGEDAAVVEGAASSEDAAPGGGLTGENAGIGALGTGGQGGIDTAGDSGDDGGGDSVICTALHHHGLLDDEIYKKDVVFGNYLRLTDPDVIVGYHAWAKPIARAMTKHKWFARIVAPFAVPWARYIADEPTVIGGIYAKYGISLCRRIGQWMRGENGFQGV